MCGLFGWSINPDRFPKVRNRLAVLGSVLALQNDSRGGHSWGFYGVHKAILTKGMGEMALGVSGRLLACHRSLMGHTRFATTGKHTVENAHPFKMASIIGAHNGIVSNHAELNRKYNRDCQVDSQHIFRHLEDKIDLEDIHGYGAISYLRTDDPEGILLGTFNSGELAIAEVKRLGIVWSSDYDHLQAALSLAEYDDWDWIATTDEEVYRIYNGTISESKDRLTVGKFQFSVKERSITSGAAAWEKYDEEMEGWSKSDQSSDKWGNYCSYCERGCDCDYTVAEIDDDYYCQSCGRNCRHWKR